MAVAREFGCAGSGPPGIWFISAKGEVMRVGTFNLSGRAFGTAAICVSLITAASLSSCGRSSGSPELTAETGGTASTGEHGASASESKLSHRVDFQEMEAKEVARMAVVGSPDDRRRAAEHLRGMGQTGLAALEAEWANDVDCLRTVGSLDADEALEVMLAFHSEVEPFKWDEQALSPEAIRIPKIHRQHLEEAFVVVTGQHDGLYSGIFWETDLEKARERSRSTGKPILSLRVLGRLDDAMC